MLVTPAPQRYAARLLFKQGFLNIARTIYVIFSFQTANSDLPFLAHLLLRVGLMELSGAFNKYW